MTAVYTGPTMPTAPQDPTDPTAPTPDRRSPGAGVWVVLPTYNEAENLGPISAAILEALPAATLLVVDDGSPDGTGRIADDMAGVDARIRVRHRPSKQGLGRAYLDGFGVEVGPAEALLRRAMADPDPGVDGGQAVGDRAGPVRRAVVHDQERRSWQRRQDRHADRAEVLGLVVRREDDPDAYGDRAGAASGRVGSSSRRSSRQSPVTAPRPAERSCSCHPESPGR